MAYLLFALSGILTALPLVCPTLAPVGWLSFAPAAYLLMRCQVQDKRRKHFLRRAYVYGLVFFECFGAVIFSFFIKLYPLDFIDGMTKSGAVAVVIAAWLGLSLLQAVVSALQFVLVAAVARALPERLARFTMPPLFAALYVVFEWLQTLTWMGVPWGRLALGQVSLLPMIQSASLFGTYIVDFVLILSGALAAVAFDELRRSEKKHAALAFISAAAVVATNFAFGAISMSTLSDDGAEHTVAALQGNFLSSEKWGADSYANTLSRYTQLNDIACDADITVWPETALPWVANDDPDIMMYIREHAAMTGGVTLTSAFWRDPDAGTIAPAVIHVSRDGTVGSVYNKRNLVPFGEYLPWADFFKAVIPPLAQLTMYKNELTPGDEATVFETENGRIGSLICFDSIYERLVLDTVRGGAELLAVSTNDSWFTDSAAVYQHNAHSVLRAVETRRWVVRAANTGISSVISPTGEVTESLAPLVAGVVKGTVRLRDDTTLYVAVGDIFVLACAAYVICLLSTSIMLKRSDSHYVRGVSKKSA